MKTKHTATMFAILAAALYAINIPLSKILLKQVEPTMMTAFLYLGATDEIGHDVGWMTKAYEDEVDNATSCILDITATLPKEYAVIVTADHGGHGRNHGDDVPEDMTIPILYRGDEFKPGVGRGFNIKDIAPTIAKLLGVAPDRNWEGTSRL